MNHREQKATTEAKHLKKLVHKHPAFRTLLDCRESNKMLTTYIWGGPEEAHESPDGPKTCIRIWTHYGFNPSTWRKNSYQVNSQNIPKRSDLAQQFRRMIVAAPGHQFVAFDSSAIEAVLVGYFAGSARYIRLAKMGVHDWVTSVKVGQPIPLDLPDEELRARCKAIKKAFPVEREMIKRVVHLSNYKGTPGRIFEEYPEHFRNEKEAKDLQDLYFNTDPGKDVVRWQNATLTLAHKEHVLKTPVGYWHEFYNVFTYDKKYGKWRLGDDAKRCIAFKPQGTASGIQTEVLLWVAEHHPWLVALLRLIIHDEIAAEVPDAQVPDAVAVLQQGFTQAWPQLGGLSIGAEGKVGRNLAEWSPDNPDGLRGI
jgi:DNA polymerase I-like protein with 3'-5' exonuclease and polymerase domains